MPLSIARIWNARTAEPTEPSNSYVPISRTAWVLLLCGLPYLFMHFQNLWRKPHYQFFPLFLIAWFLLVRSRWPVSGELATRPVKPSWILSILATAALLGATLLASPYCSAVATVLIAGTFMLPVARAFPEKHMGRCWMLLWLLIPPPRSLDVHLIQSLQRFAASSSSRLLDMLGYLHLLQGTIIEFPGRSLFVEEACSGIQSLFSLIVFTSIYVVWQRRPWLHLIPMIFLATFWAAVSNIMRLMVIALADQQFLVDLTSGWKHEAIGYTVFAFAIWMVISSDHLLKFFLDPIHSKAGISPVALSRIWNRWIAGDSSRPSTNESAKPLDSNVRLGQASSFILVVAVLCGLLQGILFSRGLIRRFGTVPASERVNRFDEDSLQKTVAPWKLENFEIQKRSRTSEEGQYSRVWNFNSGSFQAYVSFDYTFVGTHSLPNCYVHKGWQIHKVRSTKPTDNAAGWSQQEVEFRRELGREGFLIYSLFNETGSSIAPPESNRRITGYFRWLMFRIRTSSIMQAFGSDALLNPVDAGCYQIQVFVSANRSLTREEKKEIREEFGRIQTEFRAVWLKGDDQ